MEVRTLTAAEEVQLLRRKAAESGWSPEWRRPHSLIDRAVAIEALLRAHPRMRQD